ncbi:hybrid sensor histidine kinase/response regulator [Chitinophaga sp.]|uniref:hybrid sensor histidine kinase/response regulator n=1 Tax=Chitinophaga sp. TaxID=1869181 RepID=UPI002C40861C|nr:response regulator [Chitinophaga sp.]HWV66684.1 response regulator [Chitinophaga sp.]
MKTGNYPTTAAIRAMLIQPVFAGTRHIGKAEEKRPIIIINAMAIVLSALVIGVGSYFYFLKSSVFFLIGIPLETLSFFAVIRLNHVRQYFNANLLMLSTNAIFIAYWSTVLGSSISLELLLAFNTIIIFHLSSAFFLYKRSGALLACIIATVLFAAWMVANSHYNFIKPLQLSPDISLTMKWSTTVALLVFILCVMMSYVAQIRSLLASAQKLREVSERKSVFLREVFHEIRTPMNAIFSIGQLFELRKSQYSVAERKEINQLFASCYLARNIINHVLEMSRIESGNFYSIMKESVSLKDCVSHCIAVNSYLAASRGIKIDLRFDRQLMPPINSDSLLLIKILNNILSNAVKFASGNSMIYVSCVKEEDQIIFKVRNQGVVDPEIATRMFDRFVSKREQFEGTGLGLSITKHLVGLFGGHIILEPVDLSAPSTTTIAFNIPYEAGAGKIKQQLPPKFMKGCFTGGKVVIIEDDLLSAELLIKFLKEMGIAPVLCRDHESVIRIIHEEKPNLIISDLNMPGFSGRDLLQYMKKDTALKGTPVLIVSGDAFLKEEMLQAGASGFITKPVFISDLHLELAKYLPHHILS